MRLIWPRPGSDYHPTQQMRPLARALPCGILKSKRHLDRYGFHCGTHYGNATGGFRGEERKKSVGSLPELMDIVPRAA